MARMARMAHIVRLEYQSLLLSPRCQISRKLLVRWEVGTVAEWFEIRIGDCRPDKLRYAPNRTHVTYV